MNFDLSDEQVMLKGQAARLFADRASPAVLRQVLDAGASWSEPLWRELGELGFLAPHLPEAHGGLGMEPLDFAMVLEEAGRAVAPVPLFSSICLGAEAISLAGADAQKARYLPQLASGAAVATFAHVERAGPVIEAPIAARVTGGRLQGTKFPVPNADLATLAVVVCRDAAGALSLGIVSLPQAGARVDFVPGIDELVRHHRVTFEQAEYEPLASGEAAERALSALYDRAAVFAAFTQIGGAERCLHMARDYSLERKIFNRPLGGFQAIKHRLADILCLVEVARSNAWFAAWTMSHDPAQLPTAAAAARLSATEAYETAARENLQVHGGIGYTWEADCHFHYRRTRLAALQLGSTGEWADRLVSLLSVAS